MSSKPPKTVPNAKVGKWKEPEKVDVLGSKEWGLSSNDQHLSADEQKNILNGQLEELQKMAISETKSKDGLENLIRLYASDAVSQKKASDSLMECEQKLQKIEEMKQLVKSQLNGNGISSGGSGGKSVKARGVYDYTATCETELTFKEGDILTITEQDTSGWWYAEFNGQAGFVPNNYCEILK